MSTMQIEQISAGSPENIRMMRDATNDMNVDLIVSITCGPRVDALNLLTDDPEDIARIAAQAFDFVMYPGDKGQALGSLRSANVRAAFDDYHGLMYLESLTSREFVESVIYEGLEEKITFEKYPTGDEYLLKLRARVVAEIARLMG